MRSRIYTGEIMHARLAPARHVFRYPVLFFAFDLDELEALDSVSRLLGYNRRRVLSLWDDDHLRGPGSIKARALRLFEERGLANQIARIKLIATPRYLGHAFNPARFYYGYDRQDALRAVIAEVNNTFGERHTYLLDQALPPRPGFLARYEADKAFHVSPFNDRSGSYTFDFSATAPQLDIRIDLRRDGQEIIKTRMHGQAQPLTAASLRRAMARYPLTVLLTLPRIHLQAARLFFGRRLRVYAKPEPQSDQTIVLKPTPRSRRPTPGAH